eukprot:2429559-Prymnesium_polylepis.2
MNTAPSLSRAAFPSAATMCRSSVGDRLAVDRRVVNVVPLTLSVITPSDALRRSTGAREAEAVATRRANGAAERAESRR